MLIVFFRLSVLFLCSLEIRTPESFKSLHKFAIYKSLNQNGSIQSKFIEVDSVGNVFQNGKKNKLKLNIVTLSSSFGKYITEENVTRYPGNNNIQLTEMPQPGLNKQYVVIFIYFLDDFRNESHLRNKTYYSWGRILSIDSSDYPFNKYIDSNNQIILSKLLN